MTCHLYLTGTAIEITAELRKEMARGRRPTLVSLNEVEPEPDGSRRFSMCVQVRKEP